MSKQRPNLLFIWTDEQRPDTLACYGNSFVQAPHLNELAERSFVFENAYCTQPICTPSRASVLTGLWPHTHGCTRLNEPLPATTPTIAEVVDESYRCAYHGKWHLGDEIIPQHGFDEWVSSEDGYHPYYSRSEYSARRSDYHHFLVEQGYPPQSRGGDGERAFSRDFAAALAEPYSKATFLGQSAADFLRRQSAENPFLLSVNFLEPHMPFFGPLNNLYDPDEIPVGPAFLQPPGEDASLRHRLIAAQYAEHGHGGFPLETPEQWRRLRANYYGLVTLVDRAVGQILAALEESGQAENTIIVFTSDHGEMMGDHGLLAKTVLYEESVRVPMLIHVPWLKNRAIGGRFSHIDLMPTLLELMGEPIPANIQGRSRVGVLEGREELEDVVVEWNPNHPPSGKVPPPGFTEEEAQRVSSQTWRTIISREGWKLSVCDDADEQCEFFDLNTDPHELTNRWNDDAYRSQRADLLQRLKSWHQATGDTAKV